MHSWTVGKRFLVAFILTFTLTGALMALYVQQTWASSRQLDRVLHRFNRKLEIGDGIELATTEMQGAQRGLMLVYAVKDDASAEQYLQIYADSGRKVDELMAELEPMAESDAERAALTSVRDARAEWAPGFEEMAALCKAGNLDQAYKLRNRNKLVSAAMHQAAKSLVEQQKTSLDLAERAAALSFTRSLWLTAGAGGLMVVLGLFVLWIIRRVNDDLRVTVQTLNSGAEQIATVAGQVSASSQSLAQGASEQAASIEETSASTEEVQSMARRNSDHSETTARMVTQADTRFSLTSHMLDEMVSAMSDITHSSEQISHILHDIDQIAFQTNILALNAAVEAARAGEAGMGFAVVADEVRTLAQRSAQAAQDTAVLIETSVNKARAGSAKVAEVTQSIRANIQDAAEMRKLVDEINTGSREQTLGLGHISGAIGKMERITQSTAATAEQTAAAAHELAAQSEAVKDAVDQLTLLVGAA